MTSNHLPYNNILIIGGTGFIGWNLLQTQIQSSSRFTILSRTPPKLNNKKSANTPNFQHVIGTVTNRSLISKLVKSHELIIYLAGAGPLPSINKPQLDLKTTCLGALNLLETAKKLNPACRLVFTGSVHEKPLHQNAPTFSPPYAIHRHTLTNYLKYYRQSSDIKITSVLFHSLYGPHPLPEPQHYNIINHFIDQALRDNALTIYGDGKQEMSITYIEDALEAMINIINNPPPNHIQTEIYSDQFYSINHIVKEILSITGQGSVKYIPWPKKFDTYTPPIHSKSSSHPQHRITPTTPLISGLRKTINIQHALHQHIKTTE